MIVSPETKTGRDFSVVYEDGKRFVRCFCGEKMANSIVPHLRRKHPEIWCQWQLKFVELRNEGWSYRRIMQHFNTSDGVFLFSWTVIEREIRKAIEQLSIVPKIRKKHTISSWEPVGFQLERTTLWRFEKRGGWAVHSGEYRGNWPPQLVRNVLLHYSDTGDLVVDPFVGGGTTLIESWLLGRASIGIDISPHAVLMTEEKLEEMWQRSNLGMDFVLQRELRPIVVKGDARNVEEIVTSIARGMYPTLICTHPPYMDALRYTETIEGDLSHISDIETFCNEMSPIASSCYSILAPDGYCVVLIGDARSKGNVVPVGFKTMKQFLDAGFSLKDIIIKEQHRDSSTEFYFRNKALRYLIAHEYLFIFQKVGG